MQRAKSVIVTFLLVSSVFIITFIAACKKEKYVPGPDKCAGIVCQNNGSCVEGVCDCTAGYTGEFCQNKAIEPYIGKWSVSQEIVSRNDKPLTGEISNYVMNITEDPSYVTVLHFGGFMGNAEFNNVKGRIGMTVDFIQNQNGIYEEAEVPAAPANFIFNRYQPLGQSGKQLVKGEGEINSLGTQLTGEFYVVYADSTGPIEDRIRISATYIN